MRTRTIFTFVLISGMLLAGAVAFAEEQCRSERGGYCLSLAAAIPGLEFLGDVPADPGQLLARIFAFGTGFVGIAAFGMFIWGGILYLTARDSQDQVNRARTAMGNATFGLLLALVSWLILNAINPDLVRIGFPRPTPISGRLPGGTVPGGALPGGTTGGGVPGPQKPGDVKAFEREFGGKITEILLISVREAETPQAVEKKLRAFSQRCAEEAKKEGKTFLIRQQSVLGQGVRHFCVLR